MLQKLINPLDKFRSVLLKYTLNIEYFDFLFRHRSQRILALGTLALVFYFLASLFWPLYILAIGPIIWGIPHLFSSLRYNTLNFRSEHKMTLISGLSIIWLFVFAYRFSVDIAQIKLPFYQNYLLVEMISLFISYLLIYKFSPKQPIKFLLNLVTFTGLLILTIHQPIMTGLTLLIGHNYIPLINWYKSCSTRYDRNTFLLLSITYILASLGIIFGAFDGIYQILSRQTEVAFLNWSFLDIVTPFGATTESSYFWYRIVVLYAFSQSIHYFIWLKAIPENFQKTEFPPSFRWSLNKLNQDFGFIGLSFILTLLGLGFIVWLGVEFQAARYIYFGLASYHGFLEMAGLPFFENPKR